jgi:hypothetical protein
MCHKHMESKVEISKILGICKRECSTMEMLCGTLSHIHVRIRVLGMCYISFTSSSFYIALDA